MRTLLTGGTGYLGSAVLDRLVAVGHEVVAVVRSAEAAAKVAERGAVPAQGQVTDAVWLTSLLEGADAAIHLAATDTDPAAFDSAVVDAVIAAFGGTGRRYVHTSGIWEFGSGSDLDEDSPLDPPPLVAWRIAVEERLLAADVDAAIVVPGVVYGKGRGIARLLVGAPRTEDGAIVLLGDGGQHWSNVHVDDVAALFMLALTSSEARGRLIASDGAPQTVRAMSEVVAAASGAHGVVAGSVEEARTRLGEPFADALLLDQVALGRSARALGWTPVHESILDELREIATA